MTIQDRDLSGALFKEEKTNERAPDYTGYVTVEGNRYRLAAWIREAKNDRRYMSLALSKAERSSDT